MKNLIYIIPLLLFLNSSCQKEVLGIEKSSGINLNGVHIVADGNSYFTYCCSGATPPQYLLMDTVPFSTPGFAYMDGGFSYGRLTSTMITEFPTNIVPTYNPAVENVIIFQESGNEMLFTCNADSIVARTLQYCALAHAAGFKVIISTLIHRNQGTYCAWTTEAEYNAGIDEFNTKILTHVGTGEFDGIIQPHLESIFATYASPGYYTDGIHPSAIGHYRYMQLYYQAILSL